MTDPTDVGGYDDFVAAAGPLPVVDHTPRVEGNACLVVLRAGDVPAWRVRREAGLPPHGRLTFRHLREHAGFPTSPVVSGEYPDSAIDLITRLPRTKLWRAWVSAWDLRPDRVPGTRTLVAAGPGWGTIVAHDGPVPVGSSHLCLSVPSGLRLVVEPLRQWAGRVWAENGPPDAR